jgi:hypothetical protein
MLSSSQHPPPTSSNQQSRHAELVSASPLPTFIASTPFGAQASRLRCSRHTEFISAPTPPGAQASRLRRSRHAEFISASSPRERSHRACSICRRGFQPRNKPRRGVCTPPSEAQAPYRVGGGALFCSSVPPHHRTCRSAYGGS